MTHRSRSGGPPKTHRRGKNAKKIPKLHHPPNPAANVEEEEEDETIPAPITAPAAAFRALEDEEILAVLRNALRQSLDSPNFRTQVQRAKGLLFERKWLELFTDEKLLEAYAGRWGPSRALCFRDLMVRVGEVRGVFVDRWEGEGEEGDDSGDEEEDDAEETKEDGAKDGEQVNGDGDDGNDDTSRPRHILSLGGGAGSELLAVAALAAASPSPPRLSWTGADIGDWGSVLTKLEQSARDEWDLDMAFKFVKCDILPTATAQLPTTPTTPQLPFLTPSPDLTTLFFTLAELFAQSRPRTLALLRQLGVAVAPGGLLLVADSASDIAQLPLGKDGRTWPIYMVLDVLMREGWEKVRGEDSAWFRIGEVGSVGRNWPTKLENARYWWRLYRRV